VFVSVYLLFVFRDGVVCIC